MTKQLSLFDTAEYTVVDDTKGVSPTSGRVKETRKPNREPFKLIDPKPIRKRVVPGAFMELSQPKEKD